LTGRFIDKNNKKNAMTQKELFLTEGKIEINRHPITNVRRMAILQGGFNWNPVLKFIKLDYTISYLDEQGQEYNLQSMSKYTRTLKASDEEYENLIYACDSEINVFDMIISLTIQRAEEGKFNI